ncbi:serine/threonine-protein kinase [Aquisphaera insulae]|uniref:serine/threonine-protein kinase n=1 Tax=Aquisphaera insulae TaxID=2712864 RepID=UPI0013EAB56D|nr:serine/threonine-protein kinase [Aquisphaera insulae]
MASHHDILFALLSSQNGLIDQAQLIAAFQAWSRDRSRPLADYVIERGDLDDTARAGVEAMVALHLRKFGDDAEHSLASLPVGRSTRERIEALNDAELTATMTRVAADSGSGGGDGFVVATAAYSIGSSTADGQRFRVLRPHARGGLGAVFVALDDELNREVALKQILDNHADDPTSRQRFLLEAEITGGLEHPGIVPVYGLGAHADGRPYYAMRFIRGDSLKEAIERFHQDASMRADPGRRSLERRKLLGRFLDVCNAIDYAHSRGVLHRDIKPGNVIVGKHGETLVVDWGLAKARGKGEALEPTEERPLVPSSASGSAETLPGSAIGTPAYMCPEQARGDLEAMGPPSDVYSLGATLYTLLVGRAPFGGNDLGALLRDVQAGRFPAPSRIEPTLDAALEAICLRAMATKPDDRYATARALAEDIERWLADEPVAAYPEPWTRTATRWLTRHRTAVTAMAAAGLVALIGLGSVAAVQTQGRAALATKNGELEAANTALAEANAQVQARFELARDAIRSFKQGVEDAEALKEDRLRPLRDRLLGSARKFYDRLGELLEGRPDPASKAMLAESYMALGKLIEQVGQKPESLAAYGKAVALRRELAAQPGSGPATPLALAEAMNEWGAVARQLGNLTGALAAHQEAVALTEPLASGPAATSEARRVLGTSLIREGLVLAATGANPRALEAYRRGRTVREALAREEGAPPADRRDLAAAHTLVGEILERSGDLAASLAEHRAAIKLLQPLAEEYPDVASYRRELAVGRAWVGRLLERAGDLTGALAESRQALEISRALAERYSGVTSLRYELAVSHGAIGTLLEKSGDTAGALAADRRLQELIRTLAEEHPEVPQYSRDLAVSHTFVAGLLERTGDTAGAKAELRRSREILLALAAQHPEVPDYRQTLASIHARYGRLLERAGTRGEAMAEQRRALALLEMLAKQHPNVVLYRRELSVAHTVSGNLLELAGDTAGAMAEHRASIEILQALPERQQAAPDIRRDLALAHCAMARLLTTAGRPSEALAELERARPTFETLVRDSPDVPDHRTNLVFALIASSDALRDQGSRSEAISLIDRAISLAEALVRAQPRATPVRAQLAAVLRRRAQLALDAGDTAGAVAASRRALDLFEALPARSGNDWFGTACALATLATARLTNPNASTSESNVLDGQALHALRRAAAMGFRNTPLYRHEPALKPLRDRDEFRTLLLDLSFPADPFARTPTP